MILNISSVVLVLTLIGCLPSNPERPKHFELGQNKDSIMLAKGCFTYLDKFVKHPFQID